MSNHYGDGSTFEVKVLGEHFKIARHCPHRGGRMDHGVINENSRTITCPLHHSVFSLDTGEQITGPKCEKLCVRRLQVYSEEC